ncbi:hypothetical protein NUW54_g7206 [Trametes sanguinea]|uniref:Uncharacterized protein n=1 Tax=Trametes sanguinea TaxID=158606 RepID=A0ACC1PQB9_9APHY|nr:hypothetical protein NUW54_g7206 [Trametes sanguinea]
MPAVSRQGSLDIDDLGNAEVVQAQRAVAAKATYVHLRLAEPTQPSFRFSGDGYTQPRIVTASQSVHVQEASLSCAMREAKAHRTASDCMMSEQTKALPHTIELILVESETIRIPTRRPRHNPQRRFGTLLSSGTIRQLRKLLQGHGMSKKRPLATCIRYGTKMQDIAPLESRLEMRIAIRDGNVDSDYV